MDPRELHMPVKFKSRLNVEDRKSIMAANAELVKDYQSKRRRHFTQKIWKRNYSAEALSINNPNLQLPKRELLCSYLVLTSSTRPNPRGHKEVSGPFELPNIEEITAKNFQPATAAGPHGARAPPRLYEIYGHSKSSKILDKIVKSSQKGLLGQALAVVQRRKEEAQSLPPDKKVSIHDTVEKANSIYLTDLTTKIIHEEVARLQRLEVEKKTALKSVEKTKEAEFGRFRENFEQVKRNTELTIEQSNEVAKKKTALVKEIKQKSQFQGVLKHETKKLEDLAAYYGELKEFLEDVSPDYFKEKKNRDMWGNQSGFPGTLPRRRPHPPRVHQRLALRYRPAQGVPPTLRGAGDGRSAELRGRVPAVF